MLAPMSSAAMAHILFSQRSALAHSRAIQAVNPIVTINPVPTTIIKLISDCSMLRLHGAKAAVTATAALAAMTRIRCCLCLALIAVARTVCGYFSMGFSVGALALKFIREGCRCSGGLEPPPDLCACAVARCPVRRSEAVCSLAFFGHPPHCRQANAEDRQVAGARSGLITPGLSKRMLHPVPGRMSHYPASRAAEALGPAPTVGGKGRFFANEVVTLNSAYIGAHFERSMDV